ncbi:MAG TPA: acyl-CoA dehydrogenase family protein [Armatimonadota bacterium]|nr:acyl-CoA dehydrogenase family protein [Armatimonadota bacterium]
MDFTFNEDQTAVLEAVKGFCDEELAPKAQETDEAGAWPAENVRKLAELDLMGIPVPEEYGGLGMDFLTWSAVGEELSRACTTTGAVFGAHLLAVAPIMMFGTEEQRQQLLRPLATGEKIGAFALTEPGAGSDAAAVATKAVLDGDSYVLNGTKIFISNGGEAEIYVIITSTDPTRGARGMTAFVVEKGTPGFEFGKDEKKMGFASLPNRELIFTDCRVPKENVLGRRNAGFLVAMRTLGVGRIGMATGAVGLARAALEAAVPYSHQRHQFGKPISSFQAIQFMVADMATEVDCARLLTWRAAWMKDQNMPFEKEAAMAKLYASEVAMRATTKAVQIFGGYGYTREFPVERYMREAKLFEIVEGTSEVQRGLIANQVLRELNH